MAGKRVDLTGNRRAGKQKCEVKVARAAPWLRVNLQVRYILLLELCPEGSDLYLVIRSSHRRDRTNAEESQ
jgi:hypothetical protein